MRATSEINEKGADGNMLRWRIRYTAVPRHLPIENDLSALFAATQAALAVVPLFAHAGHRREKIEMGMTFDS